MMDTMKGKEQKATPNRRLQLRIAADKPKIPTSDGPVRGRVFLVR